MRRKSIKDRWMLNGIAIVLCFVLACILVVAVGIYSYYYTTVQSTLETKAKSASEFFTSYVSRTYAEYYTSAYKYIESFEDRDSLELQFINTKGKVEISSYGITAGTSPGTDDITQALSTGQISNWTGRRAGTGEKLLSISCPLLSSDGTVFGVLRYVTSLRKVDAQILRFTALAAILGAFIIIVVIISNTYFLRSITEPIRELTMVAKRIADGSYGTQAEKKYDDEIGELTDTINEMSAKIARAENMQTDFISSVSHELRTPLTAITGWSETLLYDEDIKGDSRRGVKIISNEVQRLTKMVEELLGFTRIQDGRFNLNVEDADVASELEDAMLTYGELLKKENLELFYQPCTQELPIIYGDPQRLKQVFLNLIDNAAKYGRTGGRIDVTTAMDDGVVVIRIRDYGPGIPEDELPRVKEKFYKGSSKERGSGIGLAICDEIINRHGGRLEIANAVDGGAISTVYLPFKRNSEMKKG